MRLFAAVDLAEGRAVQLVGGQPGSERVSRPDPVAVAREWRERGLPMLHLVDLDAALGRGENRAILTRILELPGVECQVGGGVRHAEDVEYWLAAGAARVIVGTRALRDPAWLADLAPRFPGRLVVAADARAGRLLSHGWQVEEERDADAWIEELNALPLGGLLVTDVGREGRMAGVDAARYADLAARSAHPLLAAGGVADVGDLRALARAGVAAAVLGMALYTGAVSPETLAEEFETC